MMIFTKMILEIVNDSLLFLTALNYIRALKVQNRPRQ